MAVKSTKVPKKPSPIARSTIPDTPDMVDAAPDPEPIHPNRIPPKEIETATPSPRDTKLPSKAATKCIYFRDSQQLKDLDNLAKVYPTGSASGIVQQLVAALLDANAKSGNQDRTVKLNDVTIYL